ncbi:MAG: Gfo/Idh/MocA family oxidoreductase [Gammaproteobacteria bacterium]|nr:Gfo/Idh/MocA family oxidoreductase [Gammaproteobacteria bacterium]
MGESQKLRFGLIGGGEGAFIGAVHRIAAELDGEAELVATCAGSDPERARAFGVSRYGVDPTRSYGSTAELFKQEAQLPESQRLHYVIIATPNHTHVGLAADALDAGFHVACDKPLGSDLRSAEALWRLHRSLGKKFLVTYNYTGYPMLREARARVAAGELGALRRIQCEYLQGWLAGAIDGDNKQANWRTDPSRAGAAGCFGDIGSHAENLVRFVSGLAIDRVCADLSTFVPGRRLDDDGNVLLRFSGGAKGVIGASQVAFGEENALSLRIYGERGSFTWTQQEPNSLILRLDGQPMQTLRTGSSGLSVSTLAATRLPPGHPEGFLEAFANLYRNFHADIRGESGALYPQLEDGLRGMRFLDCVVKSSAKGGIWTTCDDSLDSAL